MTEYQPYKKVRRITFHGLFWFLWIGGFTFLQSLGYETDAYTDWLIYYLATLPLFVLHTYLVAYWLVPNYFFKRRYITFILAILILMILSSIGELLISNEVIWPSVRPGLIQKGNYLTLTNILINGLGNEYVVIVFLAIKAVRFWNSKVGEQKELSNRKLSTEIELLQYQSYPKFILNVTDRLEKLASEKSDKTSEMIIRLSNLMTNMNSVKKGPLIQLMKEIELIRSYIDIQRMNFPKGFDINFLVTGELSNVQLPSFLLFQLVEQAFVILDDYQEKTDCTILIKTEPHYFLFSMTLWNELSLNKTFNPEVLENFQKILTYFYPENHKVMSNFEVNFAEIIFEIYT